MKHCLIDLETMGTGGNAAIISLGAVFFTLDEGVTQTFYAPISLESSLAAGLTVTAGTIEFWMQQEDAARKAALPKDAKTLAFVLEQFAERYRLEQAVTLWGNDPSFDNRILTSAYEACKLKVPYKYSSARCYRTMRALFPYVAPDKEREGTYHNAIDDAMFETAHLIKILRYLKSTAGSLDA